MPIPPWGSPPGPGGSGGSIEVTDGVTTVSPATELDFTSGATVTNGGGGIAKVAIAATAGVNSVTAGDTSIVVGGTATNPTVATGTLDVIAADHPPVAAVGVNGQKITGLANGTVSTDAAAFGQIPTALPPNGSAGGDLTGSYPNPTLAAIGSAAGPTGDATHAPVVTIDAKGRVTALTSAAITGVAPGGSAGGDLIGTYPNPTLAPAGGGAAGPIGSTSVVPVVTVDAEGRVTALGSASPAIDTIGSGTNITTNDVSTSKHGLAPKLPNDATKYLDGTGAYSIPAGGSAYPWAHLQQVLTSGTANGGSTAGGAFHTCPLNTIVNDASSLIGSLTSNQFTLGAGTYRIMGFQILVDGQNSKARLRNITDTTTAVVGATIFSGTTGGGAGAPAHAIGQFTIAGTKTFELQYWVFGAVATFGLGIAASTGESEIYADIQLWKTA